MNERFKAEHVLEYGDLVQLIPGKVKNTAFAGCIMVVTEPKSFGAQGYVQALGEKNGGPPGGQAYYRASFEEMVFVGHAVVVMSAPPDDGTSEWEKV
jgi:hypothetical protein